MKVAAAGFGEPAECSPRWESPMLLAILPTDSLPFAPAPAPPSPSTTSVGPSSSSSSTSMIPFRVVRVRELCITLFRPNELETAAREVSSVSAICRRGRGVGGMEK